MERQASVGRPGEHPVEHERVYVDVQKVGGGKEAGPRETGSSR
ncbi:MAG: hypothetical protein ABL971_15755 [Vicinamibacterales bacterium]